MTDTATLPTIPQLEAQVADLTERYEKATTFLEKESVQREGEYAQALLDALRRERDQIAAERVAIPKATSEVKSDVARLRGEVKTAHERVVVLARELAALPRPDDTAAAGARLRLAREILDAEQDTFNQLASLAAAEVTLAEYHDQATMLRARETANSSRSES